MTPLIQIQSLKKYFPVYGGLLSRVVAQVKAVESVSLTIRRGETVGLVGESGCGKTTLGRMSLRLIEPTAGQVLFNGQDILGMDRSNLARIRPKMQIIFQDPYSSLNPRFTVERLIGEAMLVHGHTNAAGARQKIEALMDQVGLSPRYLNRFPHEFSGGQRQRIGIARALALDPDYIVCDEPVSALDISIQAQIVNLLKELQAKRDLALLFISHDLAMVKYLAHRTAVMYLGRLAGAPLHPGAAGGQALARPPAARAQNRPGGRRSLTAHPARRVLFPPPLPRSDGPLPKRNPRRHPLGRRPYRSLSPLHRGHTGPPTQGLP
jgi:peptide/nickel transport system ATP-binding protein/oligopeptide transport system ATP-binding protein